MNTYHYFNCDYCNHTINYCYPVLVLNKVFVYFIIFIAILTIIIATINIKVIITNYFNYLHAYQHYFLQHLFINLKLAQYQLF